MQNPLICPNCGHQQSIVTDICGFCGASLLEANSTTNENTSPSNNPQNVIPVIPVSSEEVVPSPAVLVDQPQPIAAMPSPAVTDAPNNQTADVGEEIAEGPTDTINQTSNVSSDMKDGLKTSSLKWVVSLGLVILLVAMVLVVKTVLSQKTPTLTKTGYINTVGTIKGDTAFVTSCYGIQLPNSMKVQVSSTTCVVFASNNSSNQNAVELQPAQLSANSLDQAILDTKLNYTNKGYVISGEENLTIGTASAHEIDSLTNGIYFRNYIIKTKHKYLIGNSSYQYFVLTATSSNGQWSFLNGALSRIEWQ